MENDLNFGVFYTCYTEVNAVKYSLDKILSIYPSLKVYLISDGGSDYSFLQNENIKTFLEEDSRSLIPKINKETFKEDFWQKDVIKKSINIFLDRVHRAIQFCNTEYMLIMEPDVLVRGKIHAPPDAKLLGSRINEGISDDLRTILKTTPDAVDNNNWGAVPPLFLTKAFLKAYNRIKNDDTLFDKICKSEHRLANYDLLFPILFNLIGYIEIFNPELTECFRNPEWETSWHPILHQYRAKYPLKSEGYNGTHIIHENNLHGLGDKWLWSR